MKVKMLTLSCSPAGVRKVNEVVEVSKEEGEALIAGKFAEAIAEPAPIVPPVQEEASSKKGKKQEPVKPVEEEEKAPEPPVEQ